MKRTQDIALCYHWNSFAVDALDIFSTRIYSSGIIAPNFSIVNLDEDLLPMTPVIPFLVLQCLGLFVLLSTKPGSFVSWWLFAGHTYLFNICKGFTFHAWNQWCILQYVTSRFAIEPSDTPRQKVFYNTVHYFTSWRECFKYEVATITMAILLPGLREMVEVYANKAAFRQRY